MTSLAPDGRLLRHPPLTAGQVQEAKAAVARRETLRSGHAPAELSRRGPQFRADRGRAEPAVPRMFEFPIDNRPPHASMVAVGGP